MTSSWTHYSRATPEPLRRRPGMCLVLTRERMRMTPRVTLILKRAFSPLAERIATTWRREFRERVHRHTTIMSDVEHVRCSTVLNLNFLSPNSGKFAAECKWKSKSYQNVQNLGFFWKNRWVFWKKNEFFRNGKIGKFCGRMRIKRYYFLKISLFHLNWGVFSRNQKNF